MQLKTDKRWLKDHEKNTNERRRDAITSKQIIKNVFSEVSWGKIDFASLSSSCKIVPCQGVLLHLSDAKTSKNMNFCILKQLVCFSLYIKKQNKTRTVVKYPRALETFIMGAVWRKDWLEASMQLFDFNIKTQE